MHVSSNQININHTVNIEVISEKSSCWSRIFCCCKKKTPQQEKTEQIGQQTVTTSINLKIETTQVVFLGELSKVVHARTPSMIARIRADSIESERVKKPEPLKLYEKVKADNLARINEAGVKPISADTSTNEADRALRQDMQANSASTDNKSFAVVFPDGNSSLQDTTVFG